MGLACVPISRVPPALTLTFPPTMVRVLWTTRLKARIPLIVVVLAEPAVSIVTVVVAMIATGLQAVGIKPVFQVLEADQSPLITELIAWQALPCCQTM